MKEYLKYLLGYHYHVQLVVISMNRRRTFIHINCKSSIGIESNKQWYFVFRSIKKYFGVHFDQVFHNVNFNHKNFTIILK